MSASSLPKRTAAGILLLVAAASGAGAANPPAKPFLSPLFSSNMVLQRDQRDPIWGWAQPGDTITISIDGQTTTATADQDGKWMTTIQPPAVGGPYQLDVTGPKSVHLTNVMVGDVWLCSGQSNMTLGIKQANNAQAEITAADHPNLRLFTDNDDVNLSPTDQMGAASWSVCSPNTVTDGGMGFSAVAYYFGRDLQQYLNIPVGLIHSSAGGTPIEGWTSEEALRKALPDFDKIMQEQDTARQGVAAGTYDFNQVREDWYAKADAALAMTAPGFDDSGWPTINLPASTDESSPNKMPSGNTVLVFRRTIDVPPPFAGRSARILFGRFQYLDQTYVNGKQVGNSNSNGDRNYWIPPGVLKAGPNLIAVRIFDPGNRAGIFGDPAKMVVNIEGGGPSIPMAGEWHYHVGHSLGGSPPYPTEYTHDTQLPFELFNGKINPLIPFGIRGVIWYQGENNAGRAYQYRTLLPTLIADWRARWQQGDFPFLIAQLASFSPDAVQPGDSAWAELREAQWLTTQKVPSTAVATAIDIGDPGDIHPRNKQEMGRRLALLAEVLVYGEKAEYSGPVYQSVQVQGNQVQVTFSHAAGLKSQALPPLDPTNAPPPAVGVPLKGFAVAGSNRKFYWADAKIDGNTVVVSAPEVSEPQSVRYDWGSSPEGTLYNGANLPALPFRTDDWPLTTLHNK